MRYAFERPRRVLPRLIQRPARQVVGDGADDELGDEQAQRIGSGGEERGRSSFSYRILLTLA